MGKHGQAEPPPLGLVAPQKHLFHVCSNSSKSSEWPLYLAMGMFAITWVISASAGSLAKKVGVAVVPVALSAFHQLPACFCTCRAFSGFGGRRLVHGVCASIDVLGIWGQRSVYGEVFPLRRGHCPEQAAAESMWRHLSTSQHTLRECR